jgi:hypothetical protein
MTDRRILPMSIAARAFGLAGLLAACAAPPPAAAPPTAQPPIAAPRPVAARPAPRPDTGDRWSGLVVETVTEALAQSLNLARAEGLFVRAVEPDSPGARAGIQPGDLLMLGGGVYLRSPELFMRALAVAPLGSSIDVAVRRGGELVPVRVPVEAFPGGRLMAVIQLPGPGLQHIAADGTGVWAYGTVPGATDRGIVPVPVPGRPAPSLGPRAVASPIADRVIAADGERVYLGWAASELYIDVYELRTGRVGRVPVRGAESLSNRCRAQGLTLVGEEIWMACERPEGPALVRIARGSGQAQVEALPPTYRTGLAFDGEAVLWLCCRDAAGRLALSRTDLASGAARVHPLPGAAVSVAADARAVFLLGATAIYQHAPWR